MRCAVCSDAFQAVNVAADVVVGAELTAEAAALLLSVHCHARQSPTIVHATLLSRLFSYIYARARTPAAARIRVRARAYTCTCTCACA